MNTRLTYGAIENASFQFLFEGRGSNGWDHGVRLLLGVFESSATFFLLLCLGSQRWGGGFDLMVFLATIAPKTFPWTETAESLLWMIGVNMRAGTGQFGGRKKGRSDVWMYGWMDGW